MGELLFDTDTKKLWCGDGVTLGGILVGSVNIKDTVAEGEVTPGEDGDLLYVQETATLYRFIVLGAAYTDDNTYILSTGSLGNTRWVGVAGAYQKLDDQYLWGTKIIRGDNTQASPLHGAEVEKMTNYSFTADLSGWTNNGGWSWVGGDAYHTPGTANTLTQDPGIVIGNFYQYDIQIASVTAGRVEISVGGASTNWIYTGVDHFCTIIEATTTAGVVITPSSDFDGYVRSVSIVEVTPADAVKIIQYEDGTDSPYEERAGAIGAYSVFTGKNSGRFETLFISNANAGYGYNALASLRKGNGNCAFGYVALAQITNELSWGNTAVGWSAGSYLAAGTENTLIGGRIQDLRSGSYNTMVGYDAGEGMYYGEDNVFIGHNSGRFNSTYSGSRNIFIGKWAGRFFNSDDKLAISNSAANSDEPLIGGDFADETVQINGDLASNSDSIIVYNNSGLIITQYSVVKIVGRDTTTLLTPEIDRISSFSDVPIGILLNDIDDTQRGVVLNKGAVTVTGFDTSTSSIGAGVYSSASGALTLVPTPLQVGYVIDLNANGTIYFDTEIHKEINWFTTVAAAEAASGEDNVLCYVLETETFYRYEATAGAYVDDNTYVLSTAEGGTTRWLAVGGKYNVNGNILTIDTVANAEAMTGQDNWLIYVVETETFYRYEATGAAYTDDNTYVLSTADGGNTRWLAVGGKYNVNGNLLTVDTVANAELMNGQDGWLIDVIETETIYRYESVSSLVDNNTSVLSTADGGTTRWLAINGQYSYLGKTVDGDLSSRSESPWFYNNSGGVLAQYKVVRVSGFNVGENVAEIDIISSFFQRPLGILPTALADAAGGKILKRGALTVTGFDTTLAAVGDKVYCNDTGDLTLTKTKFKIGSVLTLNANGVIYFNFGTMNVSPIETTATVLLASSIKGIADDLLFVSETNTLYKYLVAGAVYTVDDTYTLATGDAGNTRWIAVGGKYSVNSGVVNFGTVVSANGQKGFDGKLIYVSDTQSIYRYLAAGAAYAVDSQFILATGDGGNTRWVGIAGKFTIEKYFRVANIAGSSTIDERYNICLLDSSGGSIIATLYTAVGHTGKEITFICTDSTNEVQVKGNGAETINGLNTYYMRVGESVTVISNGTNWVIKDQFGLLFQLISTVAEVEAHKGRDNRFIYCLETESLYRYELTGAAYTVNHLHVLDTGNGGNTRWIAVAGQFVSGNLSADGTFVSRNLNVLIYVNAADVPQYKVVAVSGYNAGTLLPEVQSLSALTQRPLGISVAYITSPVKAYVLKQGVMTVTGFSTLAAAIGDKVYCNATGSLTLTQTTVEVGIVLNLNANGSIYFNIGGAGGGTSPGAPTGEPLRTRIAAMNVDGAINLINTDLTLYTIPISTSVTHATVTAINRNTSSAAIRIAHVSGVVGALADGDYIFYDRTLLPGEKAVIEIPGITELDFIVVRSDLIGVNFQFHGCPSAAIEAIKRIAAYDIFAVDTNEVAVSLPSNTANLKYYICNRSAVNVPAVRMALIDGNLAALASEDYALYDEILSPLETVGFDNGEGLLSGQTIMFRSSHTSVNIVIYGEEY